MNVWILFSLIVFFLSNTVRSLNYYYITSNGLIHSNVTNGSISQTKDMVAMAIYQNNINQTGWANLEIKTFDGHLEEDQSFKAGFLEGYITGDLISMMVENKIPDFCENKITFSQRLEEFLEKNRQFIEKMVDENKDNDYWHQMGLINKQIQGMQSGYQLWKTDHNYTLQVDCFSGKELLLMNLGAELSTYEYALSPETYDAYFDHCSAIVKPLADGTDLFVAHNTWSDYDMMLRILKKYSFAYKTLKDKTKLIPGHSSAFPSYPGFILSTDDYYVLSSGLVVQETTIHNLNKSSTQFIRADNLVPEFARNIIANNLAKTGQQWTQLFAEYNSGTYNNQFMIIDYKLFKNGTKLSQLPNGLLWIIEQMPGFTRAADVTHVLREQGYWASYNVPYFPDISKMTGATDACRDKGPFYCWNSTARARIFKREQSKVVDIKSLYSLMRYNNFKTDPLSLCESYNQTCNPPYSADLTLAARNDLNDPKGQYAFKEWSRRGEGAIDAKLTSAQMVNKLEMIAVSGPTDSQQPPFQWSTANLDMKHSGQPDIFAFKPIHIKWFPLSYENITDFSLKCL